MGERGGAKKGLEDKVSPIFIMQIPSQISVVLLLVLISYYSVLLAKRQGF